MSIFQPTAGQAEAIEMIGGLKEAGGSKVGVVRGYAGTGKCLGRGTPVLMFDGSIKPVEEIRDGDRLMGDDSKPRRVLSTTRGRSLLYRINPTKGSPFTVNEDHVLVLRHSGPLVGIQKKFGTEVQVTVRDWLRWGRGCQQAYKAYRIEVGFPERPLPLDPYFFGIWLGDGHLDGTGITTAEPEVEKVIREQADLLGLDTIRMIPAGKAITYRPSKGKRGNVANPNPLKGVLREMGVLNREKFVPLAYKANSRENRLQLLAGILDSDGYLTGNNTLEVIFKPRRLAEDTAYLARSLGLAAYIREKKSRCQTGAGGIYWRIFISGNTDRIPLRVPRRQPKVRVQKKDVLVTGIRVEPLGEGDYFGFTIDGNGRFLLGDFTVTHNTTCLSMIAERCGRPLVVAPTGKAALRVSEASGLPAKTIHRWLYHAEEDEEAGKLVFTRRRPEDVESPSSRIVLVDESSMIGPEVWADLDWARRNTGCVMVLLGDGFQLPPVQPEGRTPFSTMTDDFACDAHVDLTEILRQAKDSPIIRASVLIREGRARAAMGLLPRAPAEKLVAGACEILDNGGAVICHRNATRRELNRRVRAARGIDPNDLPKEDEPILVLQNNYTIGLFNGEVVPFGGWESELREIEAYDRFSKTKQRIRYGVASLGRTQDGANSLPVILCADEILGLSQVRYSQLKIFAGKWAEEYDEEDPSPDFPWSSAADPGNFSDLDELCSVFGSGYSVDELAECFSISAELGYVLTCHKMQGSQAPSVLVALEPSVRLDEEDGQRWLYTAITRAKEKAALCIGSWRSWGLG